VTLRIATDIDALPDGESPLWLLTPLLDPRLAEEPSDRPYRRIYRHFYRAAADLFTLAPLEQADVAVIPADWSAYHGSLSWVARPDRAAIGRARRFAAKARQMGKPVIAFFTGERSHERIPVPGAWVFRKSMFRSRARERDIMVPEVFYLDLLEQLGAAAPTIRPWQPVPSVGFCGLARAKQAGEHIREAAFQVAHLLREGFFAASPYSGMVLRLRAMEALERSDRVQSAFIVRDQSVFYGAHNKARRDEVKREFLENMQGADYQLAVRGSANYSYRPWEAMSVARPPLFVDTDCVWPFEGEVDWSRLVVRVDERDLDRLPEALCDFHAALDDARFGDLQRQCRATWERYLTPQGLAAWLSAFIRRRVTV
jgi:hypothetical protein